MALSRPGASVSNRESDGQHQPQAGVEARPRGRRAAAATTNAGPHPQHRHAEVARQPGGDAADDRLLRVAGGAADVAGRRRPVVGAVLISAQSSHSAGAPTMRTNPEPTLTRAAARAAGIRVVPDGAGARAAQQAGAMTTTPPEAPPGPPTPRRTQGPRVTRDEVRDLGRLRRTRHRPQGRRRGRRPGPPPRHRPRHPAGGLRGAGVLRRRRADRCTARAGCWSRRRAATARRSASTTAAASSRW